MPCCPDCIFKPWFSVLILQGLLSLFTVLATVFISLQHLPGAVLAVLHCWFPPEVYFKVTPHFWERFIDRTRKHIWHSQPAESVSGWLLVTWPSASPLAFFFSQATIGHSEIRYLSSNRSPSRGFFFKGTLFNCPSSSTESLEIRIKAAEPSLTLHSLYSGPNNDSFS